MLRPALVIARKEIVDGLRDVRSVISSLLYVLMGPVVVGLVSLANLGPLTGAVASVLTGMMSVFTLVAAFAGGMNVAMDTIAGERERHSLVPLLLNPVARGEVMLGKWLAVSWFASAGLVINLLGFALVFWRAGFLPVANWPYLALILALGMGPLPLFAAALQLLISTVCRTIKEAQTYLSLVVFLPMGLGMFLVFFPPASQRWCRLVPLAGQQLQLELILGGTGIPLLYAVVLGCLTAALAALIVLAGASRLQRDEIVYGN